MTNPSHIFESETESGVSGPHLCHLLEQRRWARYGDRNARSAGGSSFPAVVCCITADVHGLPQYSRAPNALGNILLNGRCDTSTP